MPGPAWYNVFQNIHQNNTWVKYELFAKPGGKIYNMLANTIGKITIFVSQPSWFWFTRLLLSITFRLRLCVPVKADFFPQVWTPGDLFVEQFTASFPCLHTNIILFSELGQIFVLSMLDTSSLVLP